MTVNRDQKAKKIIKAIKEAKGLLTVAAVRAGVTYWTIWKYSKDYPSVAKAIEESKEGLLDLAEAKLYQEINSGNMTAIIFYLKTQGKKRGYIERVEQTGIDGAPIKHENQVNFSLNIKDVERTILIANDLDIKPEMVGEIENSPNTPLLPSHTDN